MLTQIHPKPMTSTTSKMPDTSHYRRFALQLFGEAARSTEKEDEVIVAAEYDGHEFAIISKHPSEEKLAVFTETSMFTIKGGKVHKEELDQAKYPNRETSPYHSLYTSEMHQIATVEMFQRALTKEYGIIFKAYPTFTDEAMKLVITKVGTRSVKSSGHKVLKRSNIRTAVHDIMALFYSDHALAKARQDAADALKAASKKSKSKKS